MHDYVVKNPQHIFRHLQIKAAVGLLLFFLLSSIRGRAEAVV